MPERQIHIEKIMYCGYCQAYGKCAEIKDKNDEMIVTRYVCYNCLDKLNKAEYGEKVVLKKGGI